jgi:predicted nucleotidyltransferase
MISNTQEKIIKDILNSYNPSMVGVFGSYARNEEKPSSDIDILVDLQKKHNLLDLIGLEQELSELLGVKVDLVTLKSVNKNLITHIQKDLIRII